MVGNYPVYYGKQEIGVVRIGLQGLYYQISGRCRLSGELVCCLVMQCGGKKENLGVLVPSEVGFSLEKKFPVKQILGSDPVFYVAPYHESVEGGFVPICPEEPFRYISRLQNSYLVYRNGQAGILVEDGISDME